MFFIETAGEDVCQARELFVGRSSMCALPTERSDALPCLGTRLPLQGLQLVSAASSQRGCRVPDYAMKPSLISQYSLLLLPRTQ